MVISLGKAGRVTSSVKVIGMGESAALVALEPAECLTLLSTAPIGRIVFTEGALPAVQPVSFLVHDDTVVNRAGSGAGLSHATDGVVVAFEADEIDVAARQGWSVTVVGRAELVTDPAELAELAALPIRSWAPEARYDHIRIRIHHVTGNRLPPPPVGEVPTATPAAGQPVAATALSSSRGRVVAHQVSTRSGDQPRSTVRVA